MKISTSVSILLSCSFVYFLSLSSFVLVDGYIASSSGGGAHRKWEPPSQQQQQQDPPTNLDVEDIFREEYYDWAKRYKKKIDTTNLLADPKYDNFKLVCPIHCTSFYYLYCPLVSLISLYILSFLSSFKTELYVTNATQQEDWYLLFIE
jgi:hypothetical protein